MQRASNHHHHHHPGLTYAHAEGHSRCNRLHIARGIASVARLQYVLDHTRRVALTSSSTSSTQAAAAAQQQRALSHLHLPACPLGQHPAALGVGQSSMVGPAGDAAPAELVRHNVSRLSLVRVLQRAERRGRSTGVRPAHARLLSAHPTVEAYYAPFPSCRHSCHSSTPSSHNPPPCCCCCSPLHSRARARRGWPSAPVPAAPPGLAGGR